MATAKKTAVKPKEWYIAEKLHLWGNLKGVVMGVELPMNPGDLGSVGYIPVYSSLKTLREHEGKNVGYKKVVLNRSPK
jgi:hypothetical protein